jgi:RNA polymerase sigma-70 factor, ECF subfamily
MGYAALRMSDSRGARDAEAMARHLRRVAAARDQESFAALFAHFAPRLKSFMMRKGTTSELAEDLVQETMISVWSKAALYAPEKGSVSTWVYTIARNLRIDKARRQGSYHFTDLDGFEQASDDIPEDERLGRSQEDGHVARALNQIPPEQREILVLSYIEDVPQSEIAGRLNLPLGTVKSRMRLAYRRLRSILEAVT